MSGSYRFLQGVPGTVRPGTWKHGARVGRTLYVIIEFYFRFCDRRTWGLDFRKPRQCVAFCEGNDMEDSETLPSSGHLETLKYILQL